MVPRRALAPGRPALVVAVSLAVTALSFTPSLWAAFIAGNLLVGLIYAMLGALAGAAVGKLGATYLLLFGAMLDLGIVQNPMFGTGEPPGWGSALPGYGPGRVIVDAAFSDHFDAWGALAVAVGWTLALAVAVLLLLGRLVSVGDSGSPK